MKKIIKWVFFSLLSLFAFLVASLFIALLPGTSSNMPVVKFHYSNVIDSTLCSAKSKARISASWHSELETTLPTLTQKWNELGPKLLAETSKLTGKPFSSNKYDIPIFLCPDLPGFGFPIMVPVRMYLKNAVIEKPWATSEFVDMVYHELLHVYIARALHWNLWTPLLRKYRDEDLNTKIHLHLFALQKGVYLNLGLKKRWQATVARSREFPPQYSRAIEIVDREGYQPFIDELRNA